MIVLTLALLPLASGCSGSPPVLPGQATSGSPVPVGPTDPWGQLAARVATAQDRRYVAAYMLSSKGHSPRSVTVTVAMDGSWVITVGGAAGGGTVDVAVAASAAGLYQCTVGGSIPGCVRVADSGGQLPSRADPRIEHLFTDWLGVLTDRQVPLSVDTAAPLAGSRGQCYSVEPSTASLAAPVDPGIYCFATDGTLTAAALGEGTLLLAGNPGPAPATVTLPAPVVPGEPVSVGLPSASPGTVSASPAP